MQRQVLNPVVLVEDNYDNLLYPQADITRDQRYTHYVDGESMLRSHTSAHLPMLLRGIATESEATERIVTVPGMCYRRDVIDRTHVGTPHQIDVWRIKPNGTPLTETDLLDLINTVVNAVLPGSPWNAPASVHPYTTNGHEIYVDIEGVALEIGECGLAHPDVLRRSGLGPEASGLAMGLGLDRLVMLAKNIPDIRLLRSTDSRVAAQMLSLDAYALVSRQPSAKRDISIARVSPVDPELLGDLIRTALGDDAAMVEEVEILSCTPYSELPESARLRMGLSENMSNVLLRLHLSSLDRTLGADEANELRNRIYASVHQGAAY